MSNIRLFGISVLVLILLAGIPHLMASKAGNIPSDTLEETLKRTGNHPLEGTWKVTWKDLGAAIYSLKVEDGTLIGYSVQLMDTQGQSVPDNTKVFFLKSFENNNGKGIYTMEYEGETYEVLCNLELKGDKLYVSYDYYGYKDTEIWERQL